MFDTAFDIIVMAGQSNSEGNGVKTDDKEFISDKVYQLADKNPIAVKVLDDGKTIIDMVYPTETVFEQAHERIVGDNKKMADFSETFAKYYIEKGYLKKDRKILIIKTAVGGTGFARNEWGLGGILYKRLCDMVDSGLKMNNNNRIVAFLWHQGECDAFENSQFTTDERYKFYYENFKKQVIDFREKYGKDIPVIAGEFVNHWAELPENKTQCDAVESALKGVCKDIGNAAVVSSEGLISNDEAVHNGDNIHFCAESVYELGKRYFKAFDKISGK